MFNSIKFKLSILYSLALILTLGIYVALAYYYTRKNLLDGLDNSLYSEVKWIRDAIEPKISGLETSLIETDEQSGTSVDSTLEDEIWNIIYEHSLLSSKKQFIQIKDKDGREIYRSLSLGSFDLPLDSVSSEENKIFLTTCEINLHKVRLAVLRSEHLVIGVAYPLEEINHALSNLFRILMLLIP